jgi:hypothetical protein
MADYNGNKILDGYVEISLQNLQGNPAANFLYFITFDGKVDYYLMRAIDIDCGSLTYRTWVTTNNPDFTGSEYTGIKCGSSPLSQIIIAAKWSV